jgi:hypothetical protein
MASHSGSFFSTQTHGVRLKSVFQNIFLKREGDNGGANSALLSYQKRKTTKLAWKII